MLVLVSFAFPSFSFPSLPLPSLLPFILLSPQYISNPCHPTPPFPQHPPKTKQTLTTIPLSTLTVAGGSASAEDKVKALEAAGVRIAVHPGEIGVLMRELLEEKGVVGKKEGGGVEWNRSG